METKQRLRPAKPGRWPWLAALAALSVLCLLDAPEARAQGTEPARPTGCDFIGGAATGVFSAVTATTNTISVTWADPDKLSGSMPLSVCAPDWDDDDAYETNQTNITYDAADRAGRTDTFGPTIRHHTFSNTVTLQPDTDYWIFVGNYLGGSETYWVRTSSEADTAEPTFSSAAVVGDKLTITFNETLAAASNLSNDAFAVKKTPSGGTETDVGLSTSTGPSISGSTVVLTLAAAVVPTDTSIKVSYTKPTTDNNNRIEDASGNETDSFSDQAVTNNTLPTITISAGTSPVTEGTDATFTVTSNAAAPSAGLTVNLTVAESSNGDYVADADVGDKTVTISSGATTAAYSVTTQADTVDETNGSVTVTVASGTGYTVGSPAAATVNVNDDDAPANNAATGAPTISGFPQVGQTLTAATGGISDSDGLTGVSWSYQWIRVDGTTETDISGATSSTYTLATADRGKTVKVKVSFQDDNSNDEELTSTATGTVVAGAPACTTGNVWCATLTVAVSTNNRSQATGYCATASGRCATAYGSLNDTSITLGGSSYTVQSVRWGGVASTEDNFHLTLGSTLPATDVARLTLQVDSHSLALSGATQTNRRGDLANNYRWTTIPAGIQGYEAGRQVTVELLQAEPTITIAAGTTPVTEGTDATFTVTASPTPAADLTVNLTVDDVEGSDFVADGNQGDKTVTITANTATATHTVPTVADTTDENNGDVTVTVKSGTGYTVGSPAAATVNVEDDDDSANNAPVFTSQPTTGTVPENSADDTAVKTGNPAVDLTITATDADAGDEISYSLDTEADKLFDIDADGAITVKVESGSALDHEGSGGSITVTVTADDGTATATHEVTISVTDVDEPPAAPAAPTVSEGEMSGLLTSLLVSWTAPTNTGPAITDYDVRYKLSSASAWTAHAHTGTATSTTITGLTAVRTYDVQVRAKNGEGDATENWSPSGSGTTTLVCGRTAAVRDGIVAAVSGVTACADVTATHLAAITSLDLSRKSITALKLGDFAGLTALRTLDLESNSLSSLPSGVFDKLTLLQNLDLTSNSLSSLPSDVFDKLTELRTLYLNANSLSSLPSDVFDKLTLLNELKLHINSLSSLPSEVFDELTSLTWLELSNNSLGSLPSGVFDELTALQRLYLQNNSLSSLPAGVFDGLSSLTHLNLTGNTGSPFELTVGLERTDGALGAASPATLKVTVREGAPHALEVPLSVTGGTGSATEATVPAGGLESPTFTVTQSGSGTATANLGTLPSPNTNFTGFTFAAASGLPLRLFNNAPTVANAIPNQPAVVSTAFSYAFPANTFSDADSDTLTYTAAKSDGTALPSWLTFTASSRTFSGTPQSTDAGTLSVKVTASDGTDSVSDTFDIVVRTEANSAPTVANAIDDQTATVGTAFSFQFAANTFNDTNSGDTLTYTATKSDGSALPSWLTFTASTRTFSGTPQSTDAGTLSVKVTASDGTASVSDTFDIVVSAANSAPTVANAIDDQTATVGTAFSFQFAANTFNDTDSGDTLTYTAAKSDDSALPSWLTFTASSRTFSGTPASGDVGTLSVKVTASDGTASVSDTFDIVVSAANSAPSFASSTVTREVAENTASGGNVGAAVTATDADSDTLTYTLGGTDASSFSIGSSSGQITVGADTALNFEATKNSYEVEVTASDGTESATATVTISVTDVDEAPDEPAAPTVAAASATSVTVTWTAPATTGPAINGYGVQFKVSTATAWTAHSFTGTGTSTTISGLRPGTSYNVQVMAKSPEDDSDWSDSGTGTTNNPTISITPGTSPVTEGTAATFTVTADAAPTADLTVNLTVTDVAGSDFVAAGNEGD